LGKKTRAIQIGRAHQVDGFTSKRVEDHTSFDADHNDDAVRVGGPELLRAEQTVRPRPTEAEDLLVTLADGFKAKAKSVAAASPPAAASALPASPRVPTTFGRRGLRARPKNMSFREPQQKLAMRFCPTCGSTGHAKVCPICCPVSQPAASGSLSLQGAINKRAK
jgi:hypothetical protein